MATVTGLTADRMLEIEAASVVDGDVVDGHLILTKHDGTTIDAGPVIGPAGPEGPMGSDLEVLTQHAIGDVGIAGQIRAGRTLTLDDFDQIGLDAPVGLWNFSGDYTDASGNGRTLTAKGSPTAVTGIDGSASGAVLLDGDDALYIADTGASDPFRVRVGSFGAWVRTAKQGTVQYILSKRQASTQMAYWLRLTTADTVLFGVSATGGAALEVTGLSKICDDRWHFVVGTYDGIVQSLYIDGVLEARALRGSAAPSELIFANSTAPFNIGGYGADAGAGITGPMIGRIDEVFVTSEILSDDKIHNLYCAKIAHELGDIPSGVSINVYPGAKGSSLLVADFPTTPLRLYNFSAGSLGNEGSNGGTLGDTGTPVSVAGADGTKKNAFNLNGTSRFTATDAGLPAGTATRSYGCWFKTSDASSGNKYLVTWGTTSGTDDTRLYIVAGNITFDNAGAAAVTGPFVADGQWHFVVVVEDNSAADGLKRKFYLDGRLVASATDIGSITLGGAGKFVIGASLASSLHFVGEIDTVFVIGAALTLGDIYKLYTKSLTDAFPSPKNAGDHVHCMSDMDLMVSFDTLDIAHKVSIKVMA